MGENAKTFLRWAISESYTHWGALNSIVGYIAPIVVEVLRYDLIYINRVKDELVEGIPALNPKKSTWNEGGKMVQETLSLGSLKLRCGTYQMVERGSKLNRFQSCRLCVADS
jgi:hypothetical protein